MVVNFREKHNTFEATSIDCKTGTVEDTSLSIGCRLFKGIRERNVNLIQDLISDGVDINIKPIKGSYNPLTLACSYGYFDVVQILVHNGAFINSYDSNVSPILALCSSFSKNEDELLRCMDLLISKKADVNLCDAKGVCPLSHAVLNGHEKLIIKLINEGVDINKEDNEGWTPIFYAVGIDNIHLVCLLKDFGANIYMLDRRGRTLVDIALEIDNKDTIELLNGCSDTDKWFSRFKKVNKPSYNFLDCILNVLPKKEDRLSGFTHDIDNILSAVQLDHLKRVFHDRNVGLGHLLTCDEDKLKSLGVHLSFERKKLLNAIQKFHEYPWNTSSLNIVSPYQELDFQIALLLGTIVRQLYLISVSTFLWVQYGGIGDREVSLQQTLRETLTAIAKNKIILKKLKTNFDRIDQKEGSETCDLIRPSFKSRRFNFTPLLLFTLFSSFIFYKTSFHQRIFDCFRNIKYS